MRIQHWLVVLAALLPTVALCGEALEQTSNQAMQRVIDQQVWKPFKQAFEGLDGEALNAIYAESVLRVTPEGLDTNGRFKQFNRSRFDANIAKGDRLVLDFWFDSRHTNSSTSYEVGFFRMAITSKAGETATYYGQFHIVLKKREGKWKIYQDWDTARIAGQLITAEHFAQKTPARF